MADSIYTSIYKLRTQINVFDKVDEKLKNQDIDFPFLIAELEKNDYKLQSLKTYDKSDKEHLLFYKFWHTRIKWKEFIAEIAGPNEEVLKQKVSINEGFVLLTKLNRNNFIYAITGGFGHIELQPYIDYQFGLDVLARLIKNDEKVLKQVKERNFVGGVLGSIKFFRNDYNLSENQSFGNYYHELKAKLDNGLLKNVFKFSDKELKRGGTCEAKSSFTIKKAVSFSRAIEVVLNLDELVERETPIELNLIRRLDRSDKALVEELDHNIYNDLYQIFKGKSSAVNVEVCHKYFDKYYDATDYTVTFGTGKNRQEFEIESLQDFNDIVNVYKTFSLSAENLEEFVTVLFNTKVTSWQDNEESTTGRLIDHLCSEFKFKDLSYFLFNREWFFVKPEFVSTLNRQCQALIKNNLLNGFLKSWKTKTESENDFNAKHFFDNDTLVLDKVTPDNIEACDILKWDKQNVYFFHVKKGFNNEMRNLSRQVEIAAKRINQDLLSGKEFLKSLYDELANMVPNTDYFIEAQKRLLGFTKQQFLEIFDNRMPVFVIAILDDAKAVRNFSDVSAFDSNIAKFCLTKLAQDLRAEEISLKILQIEK